MQPPVRHIFHVLLKTPLHVPTTRQILHFICSCWIVIQEVQPPKKFSEIGCVLSSHFLPLDYSSRCPSDPLVQKGSDNWSIHDLRRDQAQNKISLRRLFDQSRIPQSTRIHQVIWSSERAKYTWIPSFKPGEPGQWKYCIWLVVASPNSENTRTSYQTYSVYKSELIILHQTETYRVAVSSERRKFQQDG